MTTNTEVPGWIAPGTPVLVVAGRDGDDVTNTVIARVLKRYFLVAAPHYATAQFSLDRQVHRTKGSWTTDPVVIPLDSDRARKLLEVQRRQRLIRRARDLCVEWQRKQTRETRLAAIAALQAVED